MKQLIDFLAPNVGFIIAVIGFFIPPIRNFVIAKFQASLDIARENNKANNDRKNYISKVRFDKEFQIYQKLSEKYSETIRVIKMLEVVIYDLNDNYLFTLGRCIDNLYRNFSNAINSLNKYSSFISESLYEQYNELTKNIDDIL